MQGSDGRMVAIPNKGTGLQSSDGRMAAIKRGLQRSDGRIVIIQPGKLGISDPKGRMRNR